MLKRRTATRDRAVGNALIAFGALLPGIGGGLAKAGIVEALYIGEFVGIIFIWMGYRWCVREPVELRMNEASLPNVASLSVS